MKIIRQRCFAEGAFSMWSHWAPGTGRNPSAAKNVAVTGDEKLINTKWGREKLDVMGKNLNGRVYGSGGNVVAGYSKWNPFNTGVVLANRNPANGQYAGMVNGKSAKGIYKDFLTSAKQAGRELSKEELSEAKGALREVAKRRGFLKFISRKI